MMDLCVALFRVYGFNLKCFVAKSAKRMTFGAFLFVADIARLLFTRGFCLNAANMDHSYQKEKDDD
ncbi:hypothetical protein TW78_13655 [Vibrio coralliilyticus]|uniref:Uncharacterized protein n=1 Tax=Vibrio coralliilyticus TaxID=190893 RepID=A0A837G2S1_9VIBR|nr:hypothetical protein TW78_13655 [Vibrio coralliilyticus]